MSIVSSGKDSVFTLCDDPEIFARGTDARSQFGAIERAAEILIEQTRRRAR